MNAVAVKLPIVLQLSEGLMGTGEFSSKIVYSPGWW